MAAGRMSKAKRKQTKGGLSKTQKADVRKEAKKVMLSTAETKAVGIQLPGSPTVPAQELFHNQPFYLGQLLATKQGVADPNNYSNLGGRIGDEIQLMSVNVRFLLSAFRPNVTYKLVLFWYSTEVATLTDAIVYFTQGNKMLDRYDEETIAIIDQKIVAPNIGALPAADANARRSRLVTLNGNWKAKKIKYNEGSTRPRFKNIGLAVVAYDSINTLQTDQLGELVYDYKMKFKDI